CLLPLANVPLLEYTLEFLAASGVQQVFVLCCAHSDQIKSYLKQSKWNNCPTTQVETIVSQELLSVGDALRELDGKQLLHSDFILVTGDIVSNVNLQKALAEHRARRATDKNAIMTMLTKEASPNHRSRARGEECLFVLDAKTNECLQYESLEMYPRRRKVGLNAELFKHHPELAIRNDLIDCQIDICSIEVPALFTENFDYQDIRKDFLRGILESDLLGKTIYCHVLTDEYGARVRNTQMYDSVSKDILSRWTYPMVPDSNLHAGSNFTYSRPHIYKEKNVKLARTAKLLEKVVIGAHTEVGSNTRISNSVIGRNCRIGDNVVIEGAYLWDNVEIKDGATVMRSILADGVVVGKSTVVEKGCIVSYEVKIEDNTTLPAFTKLTMKLPPEFEEEDSEEAPQRFSKKTPAFIWKDTFDDDDVEDTDPRNIAMGYIGHSVDETGEEHEEDEESSEEEDDGFGSAKLGGRDLDDDDSENPHLEIAATLDRAFAENHSIDIAALELNTLKMALNIGFHDLRKVVIPGIVGRIDSTKMPASAKELLGKWSGLLHKLIHSEEDQVDSLNILQDHYTQHKSQSHLFLYALRELYGNDVLDEEAILKWYHSKGASSSDPAKAKIKEM
ncbi:hypothetical protein HK102_007097, partial [Quaeritorhiza haematococci]